jgi:hypothetical protein
MLALVTDPDGIPVALRVFDPNTSDSKVRVAAIEALDHRFGMKDAVLVRHRGMACRHATPPPPLELFIGGRGFSSGIRSLALSRVDLRRHADDAVRRLALVVVVPR